MTHEARLREMASWINHVFLGEGRNVRPSLIFRFDDTDKEVIDAGATALALTRQIAEMGIWELAVGYPRYCRLCGENEPEHTPECLYLACCRLHEKEG